MEMGDREKMRKERSGGVVRFTFKAKVALKAVCWFVVSLVA